MDKILVVDDEKSIRFAFSEILALNGFSPLEASNGADALEMFGRERPDAVLLDLKMPGMNGIDALKAMKEADTEVPVIIITSHGDVTTAVKAIKLGAYDFVVKPPDFDSLVIKIRRAIEKRDLERKVQKLNTTIETTIQSSLGSSSGIRKVIERVHQVAASDLSVIIQGETGTGKTHTAQIIHTLSGRARGPFVTVDLGAIPETLVESELFGHEKGAFTGAERKRMGYFQTACGGTLFMDEIQNISLSMQGKLLRAVEEKSVCPVGSTNPVNTDIRIIAATNGDMVQWVKERKFREDLYFRLCEFVITIPPLRERGEDIVVLAQKFCSEAAREMRKQMPELSDEAAALLKDYSWPGNIRELRNVLRRAVLLCDVNIIGPEQLSFFDAQNEKGPRVPLPGETSGLSLADWEKLAIRRALEATSGNKTKAAALLQIDYTTLLRKIKQYGVSL
jgi:DNA-binding NtrC family response regulator